LARITEGSSRPSSENAALPVSGSLIASKDRGERVSGGSDTRTGLETVIAVCGPVPPVSPPEQAQTR
jgi:hypothetical protein